MKATAAVGREIRVPAAVERVEYVSSRSSAARESDGAGARRATMNSLVAYLRRAHPSREERAPAALIW